MDGLKLFVVGESTPDREQWEEFGSCERTLVIAHDPDEALRMCDKYHKVVCEISFDKPRVLMTEENHGEF
jgi:hypothetical protein